MDTEERIRRLKLIMPILETDVRQAITSFEIMESANEVVPKAMDGINTQFAETFNSIQHALSLKVALDVSRIFDYNPKYEILTQDKASIPVMTKLISGRDIKRQLFKINYSEIAEAIGGSPLGENTKLEAEIFQKLRQNTNKKSCRNFLMSFRNITKKFDELSNINSREKIAIERLRQFRNWRLAHPIFNKEFNKLPSYSDLKLLIEVAREIITDAALIIQGKNIDLIEYASDVKNRANGFSVCVVDGLRRASDD